MHWIARVFVSAAVRRVVALLVVAVLAWLGVGSARASAACPAGGPCDAGAAYADCMSEAHKHFSQVLAPSNQAKVSQTVCVYQTGYSGHSGYAWYHGRHLLIAGSFYDAQVKSYFHTGKTCESRPSASTLFLPPGGSTRCNNGCEQKYTWMGANSEGKETTRTDYTGAVCNPDKQKDECNAKNSSDPSTPPSWTWNSYLGVCQPLSTECPAGQSATPDGKCKNNDECPISHVLNASGVCVKKEEQCPPGNVKSPEGLCLPGDGQCAAGEALGKDGTCKRDTDGDGVPDSDQDPDDPNNNDDGKQFSGGDTCNAPPTCSGDPILCGQSRIQWRIDCNTRSRANIEGGACDRIPICAGDGCKPMEYAQLIQQWKTACALEKLAAGEGGDAPGTGNPDVKAIKDALTGAGGAPDIGPEGTPGDSWADGGGGSGGGTGSGEPDVAGYGWGSTCPTPPTIDLMGVSINLDIGPLCSWLALGSYFVLGLAALGSLRIVGGGIA